MSLFAEYKLERENKIVIEDDMGFISYEIAEDRIYIEDIFVTKSARLNGHGKKLADQVFEVARNKGIQDVYGTCDPRGLGATDSMKAMLAYGFQVAAVNSFGQIVLRKSAHG